MHFVLWNESFNNSYIVRALVLLGLYPYVTESKSGMSTMS